MANELKIQAILDSKGVIKGFKVMGQTGEKSFKKMDKSSRGFLSNIKSIKGGLIGISGAIAGKEVIGFLKDSALAASDLAESVGKSRIVFGESSKEIETWAESAAMNLGLAKQEAIEFASTIGNLFVSRGFTSKDSSVMSQNFLKLAADIGALNNAATDEVFVALRAAVVGSSEPMLRFGADTRVAALEQHALDNNIKTSVKNMNAQQKSILILDKITKDTATARDNFVNTSGDMAGQTKILNAQLKDLKTNFGQIVLPSTLSFLEEVNEVLDDMQENIPEKKLRDALRGMEEFSEIGDSGLRLLSENLDRVGVTAEELPDFKKFLPEGTIKDFFGIDPADLDQGIKDLKQALQLMRQAKEEKEKQKTLAEKIAAAEKENQKAMFAIADRKIEERRAQLMRWILEAGDRRQKQLQNEIALMKNRATIQPPKMPMLESEEVQNMIGAYSELSSIQQQFGNQGVKIGFNLLRQKEESEQIADAEKQKLDIAKALGTIQKENISDSSQLGSNLMQGAQAMRSLVDAAKSGKITLSSILGTLSVIPGIGSFFGAGSIFASALGFQHKPGTGGIVPDINPFGLTGPDKVPIMASPGQVVFTPPNPNFNVNRNLNVNISGQGPNSGQIEQVAVESDKDFLRRVKKLVRNGHLRGLKVKTNV